MSDYILDFEKALNYIEDHLTEDIELLEVAQTAGYSLYHFQRIFKGMIGDSMKDYINKRRFSDAGKLLISSDRPIIDVALAYGFQSREAFSRAFKKTIGRNPSEVRSDGMLYKIREPISIEYIKFEANRRKIGMTPRIVTLPKKQIVGTRKQLMLDGNSFQQIPVLWERWYKDQSSQVITSKVSEDECFGICIFDDKESFDYMIGYEVSDNIKTPTNMSCYMLESSTYGVFETIGPIVESVQKTWDYIYTSWLPSSDYKHAGTPDLELYYPCHGELVAKIYVPLVAK